MTMSNNDMAALFPDVIQCMQIQALEIKKMYVWSFLPGDKSRQEHKGRDMRKMLMMEIFDGGE